MNFCSLLNGRILHTHNSQNSKGLSVILRSEGRSEVCHPGPSLLPPSVQPSDAVPSYRSMVPDCPQTHFPDCQGPEELFGQGQQIGDYKMSVPFSCGKQSWWLPKEEAKPGSFLTQFTPLPVQRGANCTSQSCLSRRVYPNGGQALLTTTL